MRWCYYERKGKSKMCSNGIRQLCHEKLYYLGLFVWIHKYIKILPTRTLLAPISLMKICAINNFFSRILSRYCAWVRAKIFALSYDKNYFNTHRFYSIKACQKILRAIKMSITLFSFYCFSPARQKFPFVKVIFFAL